MSHVAGCPSGFFAEWDKEPCIRHGTCDSGLLQTGAALTCHGSGETMKRGPPMRGTHRISPLVMHRDAVAERIRRGEQFGTVEDTINEAADLSEDQKAALWLFAFSLRDRSEQLLDARAHLAAVQ
jgi:hypothetical protein